MFSKLPEMGVFFVLNMTNISEQLARADFGNKPKYTDDTNLEIEAAKKRAARRAEELSGGSIQTVAKFIGLDQEKRPAFEFKEIVHPVKPQETRAFRKRRRISGLY